MKELETNLPYPPSANSIWRCGRGHVFKSKKYTEFRKQVARILSEICEEEFEGDCFSIFIKLFPGDRRRRDADNPVKALFDAITESKQVWEDDKQVCLFGVEMGKPAETPFVHIAIRTIDGLPAADPSLYGGVTKQYKHSKKRTD